MIKVKNTITKEEYELNYSFMKAKYELEYIDDYERWSEKKKISFQYCPVSETGILKISEENGERIMVESIHFFEVLFEILKNMQD